MLCASFAQAAENAPGYSGKGLEYLLNKRDYERFDWYMDVYLKRYPDTATLYLMKGYRYFDEAITFPLGKSNRLVSPSGGIPRRYPSYLVPDSIESMDLRLFPIWNKKLLDQAFKAMRKARSFRPDRKEISHGLCQMALETGEDEVFLRELDTLSSLFPDDSSITEHILEFAQKNLWTEHRSEAKGLINRLLYNHPRNSDLLLMKSKLFYARGELDSAAASIHQAHTIEGDDREILRNAVRIEAIRGNYREASRLCRIRYALTDSLLDREQAIFFSLISDKFDSLRSSAGLQRETLQDTSVLGHLDNYRNNARGEERAFFTGDLFHLNFPLINLHYLINENKVEYHMHMAGAFYAVSQYDSAAYHNLNLLRNLSRKDNVGFEAGYNLAAEYFAAGRKMLSFQRFLHVYNHFRRERNDSHLLYAMGVTYESFGNLGDARYFYNRALAASDKDKEIYRLAGYRLKTIKGPGRSQPH